MGHSPTPQLLSAREAADYLGVSVRTLDRYIAAGHVTARQVAPKARRRFDPADLQRILSQHQATS